MKTIALIFCVAVVGTWAASVKYVHQNLLDKVRTKCQGDPATHVDNEIWKKVINNDKVEFPTNWGTHMLCISKGTGFQNADGSINVESIKTKVAAATSDQAVINQYIQDCAVNQATPELTARFLFKCFHGKEKVHQH